MLNKIQSLFTITCREKREVKGSVLNWVKSDYLKTIIGNVEAKELICMTHGLELKGGLWVGEGVQGRGKQRGEMGQL